MKLVIPVAVASAIAIANFLGFLPLWMLFFSAVLIIFAFGVAFPLLEYNDDFPMTTAPAPSRASIPEPGPSGGPPEVMFA